MPSAARTARRRPASRSPRTGFHKVAVLIVFASLASLEATREDGAGGAYGDRSPPPSNLDPLSLAAPGLGLAGAWW